MSDYSAFDWMSLFILTVISMMMGIVLGEQHGPYLGMWLAIILAEVAVICDVIFIWWLKR